MSTATACTLIPPQLTDSPADPTVSDLVARAKDGDRQAWDALVDRYAPLIWSICRRHRLGPADADDVAQSVWLRLVDQLDRVRDPAALPDLEYRTCATHSKADAKAAAERMIGRREAYMSGAA